MKKTLLLVLFGLFLSMQSYAQYNYQNGLLPMNGITFKVQKIGGDEVLVMNNANVLNETNMFQTTGTEICGDGEFDKAGKQNFMQACGQVFPPSRRGAFLTKHRIYVCIYASPLGKIQEVTFSFDTDSPVTPQELYQLEVALKALPPMQFHWDENCTGVNYKITGMNIYVNELE
jgi:hypothetical protein